MSEGNLMPEVGESLDDEPLVLPVNQGSQDIDAISWLSGEAERAKEVGYFETDGRRLRIAAVTEAEDNFLLRKARKLNKTTGKIEQDMLDYRRRYVAFSLTKADPQHEVTPEQLLGALSGNLTRLQKAILQLSGNEITKPEMPDPFGSSI